MNLYLEIETIRGQRTASATRSRQPAVEKPLSRAVSSHRDEIS